MEQKFSKEFFKKEGNKPNVFSADTVSEKRSLGEGRYGQVYEVVLSKGDHDKVFTIKDYSKNGEQARSLVEQAYQNYLKAKEAGLKVFPTVRISDDKPQLLLTLGTTDDQTLISKDSHIPWNKVGEIHNILRLISEVGDNVLKGSKAGMKMRRDVYFFVVQKSDPTEADFIVGDYERPMDSDKTQEQLFKRNMQSATDALGIFIEKYIVSDKVQYYKNIVAEGMASFEKEHRIENS
jgi:hypothetical protein